ncbi:hypothetical protein P153DRAFT_298850 [Dothidotthia symphoricarpi CBS 119687]|uniref:Uncharacterized protein n=1 Tax=Dothidotthia symphoricarpi CBS 119687 TaxID=1392245 RepID=A0A6A6A3V2_9PLEO|nr:uncharacterized protein P153DRAFT_298850 [Dothidotthia symphoricarpi CBS 119687]KAF2125794.1 hypothetical protein P153DRAFT_298850 [Dothidotthia symphoricarpi CBS 119687]
MPVTIPALGPQFNRLPNELLLEIFKHAVMLPSACELGDVIDEKTFKILLNVGPFARLRRVCKTFSALAIQVFYECNKFMFTQKDIADNITKWQTSLPAQVPWSGVRHFLRRMTIHITLEDFFMTLSPEQAALPPSARQFTLEPLTNVQQLLEYCPGAVQLHGLTNALTGFSSLHNLDLHISTDVRTNNVGRFLRVLEDAGIKVRARKVLMDIRTVEDTFELWHPLLQQVVVVE